MRIGQTLCRGVVAAHGVLLGALFLFLLHAPLQVLNAVAQGFSPETGRAPGQQPDAAQLVPRMGVSCGTFVFSLAVFFLFPLVLGGILGQVQDRLESPRRAPGVFGRYGRAFYSRLLGNQALVTLAMIVLLAPVMVYMISLVYQALNLSAAAPGAAEVDSQQITRHIFFSNTIVLTGLIVCTVLVSVVGMVYWVANCIVVAEGERVVASRRRSLHFCWHHFPAVLALWLVNLAAGLVMSPFGLLGSGGIVTQLWVLVPLAVIYAALIAYWGVLLAGMVMSLYLAGRQPAAPSGSKEPVLAGPA